jgi:hypothetical protein
MRWKYKNTGIAILVITGLFLVPDESQALPSWARKYGVSCVVCHTPGAPRLNVTGHQFRKLGYRMPEEVGGDPKYKEIGEYLSMRGRARYEFENFSKGADTSRFKWNDATLFYGGPVTKNLSGFFEWEWEDTSEISLLGQMSWLMGGPEHYINFRLGQMHTLTREGFAGLDRPTGISTPDALSIDLTTGGTPFKVNEDQKGIEASVGLTKNARIIAQVLNGINTSGNGASGSQEGDTDKDLVMAYEHILTDRGSGFSLFGYKGVYHNASGTDETTQFNFYRLGATGSLVFATPFTKELESELQGGLVFARDVNPAASRGVRDIHGMGYWVGVEQWFGKGSIFARFDSIDPDERTSKDQSRKATLGSTYSINDHLRWANEVYIKDKDSGTNSAGVTSEMMFNF